jgi:3-oxoacyl-[acyl-carrier protein] reductase
MSQQKKVAFVTGAAMGLGLATAKMLSEEGYRVVMADIDQAHLEGAVKQVGEEAYPLVMDVSDATNVSQGCKKVSTQVGDVSVLINNAGVISYTKVVETSLQEWRRVMSVNLDGAFYVSQQIVPGMKKLGWGRIVNVCSLAMKVGGLYVGTAYVASKGGLASMTFALAKELAPFGITVNAVAPVHLPTPMTEGTKALLGAEVEDRILKSVPVGRLPTLEETLHAIKFLVSPSAGYITGEIIDINGGLHMD